MHLLVAVLLNPALFGIVLLFAAVVWMLRDTTDKSRPLVVIALVVNLFFGVLMTTFMVNEGGALPWKYDHVLFRLDASLGIQAVVIARYLQGALRVPLWIIYMLMVPMMVLWFPVTRRYARNSSLVAAYAVELVAGPLFYALLPACGPIYAFGSQWLHPSQVVAVPIRLAGLPNAFPSLHVGSAMVLVYFAPTRRWRLVALFFLAATMLATLSTGEHYVVDLAPGMAFGCFAASAGLRRMRGALAFLGVGLAWSLAARFASPFLIAHGAVLRSAYALTVAAAILAVVGEWNRENTGTGAVKPPHVELAMKG